MSDGFKIFGDWSFGSKKKIVDPLQIEELAKKIKSGADVVKTPNSAKNNEAELVALELDDDLNLDDNEVKALSAGKKFIGAQTQTVKHIANTLASGMKKAFSSVKLPENYTAVQDIYLTGGNPNANIAISPSKIDPKNPNGTTQTITAPGANKTNNPQQGSTLNELINNAYALDTLAKNDGKNIKDLSYDQILNTNLFKEGETTPFKVIAPQFNMPMPKGASGVPENMQVAQKQYSTQNSSVDIVNDGKELGENQYTNVTDAIAAQYGLNKDDADYENALKTIAFQIANDPKNAEAIETFINSLPEDEAVKYLNDNTRVDALLAAQNIKGLHLPDNVLVNSIAADANGKNYTYTTGSTVYQLSPLSPVDGQPTGKVALSATFDGKETAGSIANLEDILKYSQDPRTGQALTTVNDKDEVVSNIKDEAAQGMATAYMMNSIKDNPAIFAASQEIDGNFQMFGAYEIKDETVLGKMNELLDAAKAEGLSNDDAAAKVRTELVNQFGDVNGDGKGKLEDFLEKYGTVNLDNAKKINFYDEDGNIRFKTASGKPVTYKVTETYVRFGSAKAVTSNNGTPSSTPGGDPFKPTPSTGTTSSTPGTTSSTPGTTSSTPVTTSSTSRPSSSTPGTTGSTTRPSSSTPGTTTSTTRPSSSTPGTTGSTTRPSSSTPGTTGSTTRPSSSTPGTTGSTTRPSSSTPGTTTSTTRPSSSTPGTTGSTTRPTGSTSRPSSTPSFNPPPVITDSGDPTPSTQNPIPSSTHSSSQSTEPVSSDCPPPPPPSNSTTSVTTDATQNAAKPSNSQSSTNNATDTTTSVKNESSGTESSEPATSTNNNQSAGSNNVESTPPPPPPSAPSNGTLNNVASDGNTEASPKPVENAVTDNTSTSIKDSDDTEKRRGE